MLDTRASKPLRSAINDARRRGPFINSHLLHKYSSVAERRTKAPRAHERTGYCNGPTRQPQHQTQRNTNNGSNKPSAKWTSHSSHVAIEFCFHNGSHIYIETTKWRVFTRVFITEREARETRPGEGHTSISKNKHGGSSRCINNK